MAFTLRGVAHRPLQSCPQICPQLPAAAEQNQADAQNTLGGMYAYGRGVPQDRALAYMFFSLAASNGNVRAARNKVIFGQTLSQREVQEGQALAKMWRLGMPLPALSETGAQEVPAKP